MPDGGSSDVGDTLDGSAGKPSSQPTAFTGRLRVAAADIVRAAEAIEAHNAALGAANWQLEMRVADRTASLEQALADSARNEARFRAVAETVPQLIWTSHPEGRWTYANPRWVAYTGQAEPNTHELGWLASVHPEDRAHTMEAWHEATVKTGRMFVEHRIRRTDGTFRWFETTALPAGKPNDPRTEWVGASSDVHDRKLAEAELRRANEALRREAEERRRELDESDARMAAYFEAAPEPLFVVAEAPDTGRFLHEAVNPACERATGWQATAVRGRPASAFMPPLAAGAAEAAYRRCRDLGAPTVFEATLSEGGPALRISLLPVAGEDEAEAEAHRPARMIGFVRPPSAAAGAAGTASRGAVVPFPLPRPGHL